MQGIIACECDFCEKNMELFLALRVIDGFYQFIAVTNMRISLILSALLLFSTPAGAQMILPGAVNAPPQKTVKLPGQNTGPARPKVVYSRIPGEDAVAGRVLMQNGALGSLEFGKTAEGLAISKLTLAGNMISRPGDACQVPVISATPSPLSLIGKPDGVLRYQNSIPACTFTLDILQGAVIVKSEAEICKFQASDCQVRPNGMWGPRGTSISEEQIKADNSARPQAETALRASYRSLMDRHSDRAATKAVAAEQAAFSSAREELCRDYALEDKHGFCDTRFTEAKVASVRLRLGEKSETETGSLPKKPKKRKARAAAQPAATMDAPSF